MTHSAGFFPASDEPAARAAVHALRPSLIREVANAGFGVPDMLPFWFGESDRVTPDFIRDAAAAALRDGATFYTHNLGTAALRDAIAAYVSARHGATAADTVAVTSSGVSALMLAAQMLVGPGERVVAVTPLWPNLVEIPKILGAQVDCVPLGYGDAGWQLDVGRLLPALTPDTRMLLINSPNNPTGWTMSRDDQRAVLAHCRRHGIWLVADEVYERLAFDEGGAPSFLDIASRDERVVVVNSFSKAWAMTGWRLGWLIAPASVMGDLSKLVEYNTSCAPGFVQAAGEVALRDGEPFVRSCGRSSRRCATRVITWSPRCGRCRASRCRLRPARCTCSCGCRARPTAWRSARRWCATRGSAWRPVERSARRERGSCAGVMRAIRRGSTRAWSDYAGSSRTAPAFAEAGTERACRRGGGLFRSSLRTGRFCVIWRSVTRFRR